MTEDNIRVEIAKLSGQVASLRELFGAEKLSSKEAITAAFIAAETATAAALQAQKESADKSEQNANKQLEQHDDLIRKIESMTSSFPDKESVAKDFQARDERINIHDRAIARAYGAAATAIALAGIAIGIVAN